MEMRKFIVEIHPDGRVYATEYEDPGDRLDIRDALRKLDQSCYSAMAIALRDNELYAVDALDRIENQIAQVLGTYWK